MQATASIQGLEEVLADDGMFPASKGFKDPSAPSFVFFDDDREIDPEVKAFRDDLLAFEEWNARREGNFKVDETVEVGMFTVQRHLTPWDEPEDKQLFRLCQYSNLFEVLVDRYNQENPQYDDQGVCTNPFKGIALIQSQSVPVTREALLEVQARNNWLVDFHKRQTGTNDHWHRALKKLALEMEDEDDDLAPGANPIMILKKVLSGGYTPVPEAQEETTLPGVVVNPIPVKTRARHFGMRYAPGPVDGTVFVNKTLTNVQKTKGTNPYSAKEAFAKNKGLTGEFVSVDRVQYANEKVSRYVVGQRKTSDTTPSGYYDPEPSWKDHEGGTYAPRACALFRVPKSCVMPLDSHRLTIREFERALIAGAECYDDADEALAGSIESDFSTEGAGYFEEDDHDTLDTERLYDGRVSIMNVGKGCSGRHFTSFTEEEDYLYGILRMIGDVEGQELMTLTDQDENMLHRHIMSKGWDSAVSLVKFVSKDNPEMLDFVKRALFGDQEIHRDTGSVVMDSIPPIWESDMSIPTGPGLSRRANWTKWSD